MSEPLTEHKDWAELLKKVMALAEQLKQAAQLARAIQRDYEALMAKVPLEAILNPEFEMWLKTRDATDLAREGGELTQALSDLRDCVQTTLWRRMEETNTPSRKFPALGVQFVATHALYPAFDREAIEAAGLSMEEVVARLADFFTEQGAPELIDRSPRINFQRLRSREYLGRWLEEGVMLPDWIKVSIQNVVQVRKL